MSRSVGRTPPLRLVADNPGVQLRLPFQDVVAEALPLARELQLMAAEYGPASRAVADELVAILERPRRPRRIA